MQFTNSESTIRAFYKYLELGIKALLFPFIRINVSHLRKAKQKNPQTKTKGKPKDLGPGKIFEF
jgi:hypothetical protein